MGAIYQKTDNYALDLYGDKDPADLRDGHNANMRTIDGIIKDQSDSLAGVKKTAEAAAPQATTYTKEEVDTLKASKEDTQKALDLKADKSTTYTKDETDKALDLKANKSDTYTKTDIDTRSAALVKKIQNSPVANVLCSYFLNDDETVYFAESVDGVNFTRTPMRIAPTDGSSCRDPSLARWSNQLICTYTRPTQQQGGAFGAITTIGLAMQNGSSWTILSPLTPAINNVYRIWAPDFFVDNGVLYIVFSMSVSDPYFQAYEIHTTSADITNATWSAPQPLQGLGGQAVIDHHIVRDSNGLYHNLFASEKDSSYPHHATAPDIHGPWKDLGQVDAQLGQAEGPTTVPLVNGGWRAYWDKSAWSPNHEEIVFMDFNNDFSSHGNINHIPMAMRHMGTICATDNNDGHVSFISHKGAGGTSSLFGNVDNFKPNAFPQKTVIPLSEGVYYGGAKNASGGIKVPVSGVYQIGGQIQFRGSVAQTWINPYATQNGNPIHPTSSLATGFTTGSSASAPDNNTTCCAFLVPFVTWLDEGDIVNLCCVNTDQRGATVTIFSGTTFLTVVKVD